MENNRKSIIGVIVSFFAGSLLIYLGCRNNDIMATYFESGLGVVCIITGILETIDIFNNTIRGQAKAETIESDEQRK